MNKVKNKIKYSNTTFNIPNLVGKFLQGANSDLGTTYAQGLPDIYGEIHDMYGNVQYDRGCFYWDRTAGTFYKSTSVSTYTGYLKFRAGQYNSIYGNSTKVQPNSQTANYIIKY